MAKGDTHAAAAAALNAARRIVVKIGSSLLIGEDDGINSAWLTALATDIAALRATGKQVVIVSSGAVAVGRRSLGLRQPLRLEQKQAASAAGQPHLINAWQTALEAAGIEARPAQILLTQSDTKDRRRYLNARAAIDALLEIGAQPIVNENDTVATAEIRYGDNDRLAAHTAELAGADLLVILSDVDGLFTANPATDDEAHLVPVVDDVTPDIEAMAGDTTKSAGDGAGGMATKVSAAKIASAAGCATIIAPGKADHPLRRLKEGGPSTYIRATQSREAARKVWIRNLQAVEGGLTIDDGAVAALRKGASLLPAGITKIDGEFRRGDLVVLRDSTGQAIARGLIAYDAKELSRVVGLKSEQAMDVLGYRRRAAVVERDDLIMAST